MYLENRLSRHFRWEPKCTCFLYLSSSKTGGKK